MRGEDSRRNSIVDIQNDIQQKSASYRGSKDEQMVIDATSYPSSSSILHLCHSRTAVSTVFLSSTCHTCQGYNGQGQPLLVSPTLDLVDNGEDATRPLTELAPSEEEISVLAVERER